MAEKAPWICALVLAFVAGGLLLLAPGEPLLRLGLWAGALLIYAGMLGAFGRRFAVEGLVIAILLAGLAAGALFAMARVRAAPGHTRTDTIMMVPVVHPSSMGDCC
jgi:hypothetical protein